MEPRRERNSSHISFTIFSSDFWEKDDRRNSMSNLTPRTPDVPKHIQKQLAEKLARIDAATLTAHAAIDRASMLERHAILSAKETSTYTQAIRATEPETPEETEFYEYRADAYRATIQEVLHTAHTTMYAQVSSMQPRVIASREPLREDTVELLIVCGVIGLVGIVIAVVVFVVVFRLMRGM
jgi:hypothetical protein